VSQFHLTPADVCDRCGDVFRYSEAGRCIRTIVHDINNYLGAVMAYADLVEMDEGLGSDHKRMLGEMQGAIAKSTELLNYIAVISRDAQPEINITEPAELLRRTIALRRHRLHVRDVKVETIYDPVLPTLTVDLPQLQFALLCIVLNAEDALLAMDPAKDGPRRLRLAAASHPEGVCYKVWNSGPPVAAEDIEHIFEPFTTSHPKGHLGLGLSTARGIAEEHQGTLTYDPEEGFVLFLPRNTGLTL
jgi:signal transduction histidine kinase